MKRSRVLVFAALFFAAVSYGQELPELVGTVLNQPIQSSGDVVFQLREYLMDRAPTLPKVASAADWTAKADEIRNHLVNDVIFHGWPKDWVDSPPHFEEAGTIETGKGYRIRKLRYEIVPGFWSAALLYEPANLHGKVPAILNVNGHVGPEGKTVDWKQKRCINYALRGMLALNIEYLNMGELYQKGNDHGFLGQMDLAGVNGVGLFYLVMRRGLDYLYNNPHVDRERIGMTGLSGGGWQTMMLGGLDPRVKVAVPVAGYCAFANQLARVADMGDNEQDSTDFFAGQDYVTLTAMRAPRPTLLINNAEDSCCFRAPLVKPYIYDQVKPFFALYGAQDGFQFHENTDPGYHNYERDNRQQSYRFFNKYFHLTGSDQEILVDSQIKPYNQLVAGLPQNNLTILGLARELAGKIEREPIPAAGGREAWAAAQRTKLKDVVRYKPVTMKHVWAVGNTLHSGLASISYRFELSNRLSATGVWLKSTTTPDGAPIDIVLDDQGKSGAAKRVWDRVPEIPFLLNRGDQVLAVDLLFSGDDSPQGKPGDYLPSDFASAIATVGDRPLGLEAAQLIAVARWAQDNFKSHPARVELAGIRSQLAALVAAALEPRLFSQITIHEGMESLGYLFDKPAGFDDAPDIFCLDLYKDFDIDRLIAVAGPTQVIEKDSVQSEAAK